MATRDLNSTRILQIEVWNHVRPKHWKLVTDLNTGGRVIQTASDSVDYDPEGRLKNCSNELICDKQEADVVKPCRVCVLRQEDDIGLNLLPCGGDSQYTDLLGLIVILDPG